MSGDEGTGEAGDLNEMEKEMQALFGKIAEIEGESKFIDKSNATKIVADSKKDTFAEEFRQREQVRKAMHKKRTEEKKILRCDGRKVWTDQSLAEWPENDYRIHVSNLPADATDKDLTEAFSKYKSFARAKVIFDSSGRNRRYGFVSLLDMNDYIDAMKTMANSFIKSRRVTLAPSKWRDRNMSHA